MAQSTYPGYDRLDDGETVDFPYHGSGRKGVRHKYDMGEATLVHHIGISKVWDDPTVTLDVAVNFGPGMYVRINPGRSDIAEKILDGHGGH